MITLQIPDMSRGNFNRNCPAGLTCLQLIETGHFNEWLLAKEDIDAKCIPETDSRYLLSLANGKKKVLQPLASIPQL